MFTVCRVIQNATIYIFKFIHFFSNFNNQKTQNNFLLCLYKKPICVTIFSNIIEKYIPLSLTTLRSLSKSKFKSLNNNNTNILVVYDIIRATKTLRQSLNPYFYFKLEFVKLINCDFIAYSLIEYLRGNFQLF